MTARIRIAILEKIVELWGEGYDTLDISRRLYLHEADVYNQLSFVRQIKRGIAQNKGTA